MKMRQSSVLDYSVVICLFIIVSHVHSQTSVNYRLSNNIAPSIYDLHIKIDLDGLNFAGVETIHAHATQPSSIIELHTLDLTIDSVQVNENGVDLKINSHEYFNETQMFRITLDQSLMANSDFQLNLEFKGEIRDDMKGLYRSSYYEYRSVEYMATTFSAAAYARKIFPCFDEPAFKAEFRLKITNKEKFVTLANTAVRNVLLQSDTNGEVWKTVEFEPTPVMSTYLVAFATAQFENLTTFESHLEFSVYSGQFSINSMKYALDIGRQALKTLETYVGHNYTLKKMDFIAIDDFLMGAMENWGLVSFESSRILNPDGKRNRRKIQEITNIITHELVHMFFGNQVTCEYWDYVWLNEGFATYLEQVIADKILPHWRILDYFLVDRMHDVMLQDVYPKTHPMTRPINTPDEITKIYDFVAYPKAASVIRMIEHIMTPEIFQKSLELHIAERSFSTSTDEQLYEVLERTRRSFSTANYPPLPEVFRSWANNPGYPILNVEFNRNTKTARISQELFVPFINSTAPSKFYILYNYAASSGAVGFGDTTPTNWIRSGSAVEHSLELLNDDERWVIFNVQQTGYYRVNYDVQNWIAIIDELNSERYDSIHSLNRAQLLDDSFNLARYDYLNFNITLSLIEYLHRETELIPLIAGFKSIEFMMTFLDQEDFYEDLRAFLLDVVDKIYVNINNPSFEVTPDDSDYHVLRKLHVNSFACKIGTVSCLRDATMKLFLFEYDYNTLDVDERPYLYCGVLNGDLALDTFHWTQLRLKLLQSISSERTYRDVQEEINEIFQAFSTCDKNINRIEMLLNDVFIHDTKSESYKTISKENALQVVGNLIKTSSAHREALMNFYSINFAVVNTKVPLKETLSMFAEAINTKEHLEHFHALLRLANLVERETIETIEENIRWMTYKKSELADWVNGATELKASLLAIATFIFVILVK